MFTPRSSQLSMYQAKVQYLDRIERDGFYGQVTRAPAAALQVPAEWTMCHGFSHDFGSSLQDNWPVHYHDKVRSFFAQHPRMQGLYLPTYTPRLNPAEKFWRWVRQPLCHAHSFCDDSSEFKAQLRACFAQAAEAPAHILRHCGMGDSKIHC